MSERPTLWDWARRAYAAPGVQALCLALQDEHGQSVCLLLWAAWTAALGRSLDPATIACAVSQARTWQDEIIDPLRGVRRRLKRLPGQPADRLYDLVKAMELEAEAVLLAALEAGTPIEAGAPADRVQAMAAASAGWGAPAPRATLEALAAAFPPG